MQGFWEFVKYTGNAIYLCVKALNAINFKDKEFTVSSKKFMWLFKRFEVSEKK